MKPCDIEMPICCAALVAELTNKTPIKEYYEAGFDALAGALAKNKKLKDVHDPTARAERDVAD